MRRGLASCRTLLETFENSAKHFFFDSSRQFGTKAASFVGGDAKAASTSADPELEGAGC